MAIITVRSPIIEVEAPDGTIGHAPKVSEVYREYIYRMETTEFGDPFIVEIDITDEGAALIAADPDYEVIS